ncbi:MAG: CRISPR-associated endonuclease Cas2 [Candidatus Binatus sp.]|uniref:CRISPR-associated endonuclease Cas2 n=1 Tax=Candidatus Binatus sp. TaxID=2811406 RepID=UPI003D10DA6A
MAQPRFEPLGWRTVWVIALFDLPVMTAHQRRAYTRFRKELLNDGFTMMQYSVYQRHCASPENSTVHMTRLGARVPAEGEVRFMTITDKQFEKIVTFVGKKRKAAVPSPAQLEFF